MAAEGNQVIEQRQDAEANPAHGRGHKKGTDEQFNRLGTGSIPKLLMEFGIPAVASLIISGLYNVLSAIFLGQGVGTIGLAVSTVANPMMILFMALALLVGNGGNALAAIKLGQGKKDEAEKVLGNTLLLGIMAWIVMLVIVFVFIDPILSLAGATEETWTHSQQFIQILSIGSIFQILGLGINNFIRSAGDPNRALWSMLSGTLVCVALSYLFVIVLGFGVPGQACATITGQAVTCAVVLYYFSKSPKSPFKLKLSNIPFKRGIPSAILALGSASFLLQLALTIVSFIINNQVGVYGALTDIGETGCFAVFAVMQRVALFVMLPAMGIPVAAQPILGYNFGARIPRRIKATLKLELKVAFVLCLVLWGLIEIFTAQICMLFGIESDLLEFCVFALRLQTVVMPLMIFQIVISSYFQATARPARSIFLSLTRQLIFLIPLYLGMPVLIGAFFPGVDQIFGVVVSPPIADVLSFICAIIFIVFEFRRLNAQIREEDVPDGDAGGTGIETGEAATVQEA